MPGRVLVLGAGPAGLAVAASLRSRDIPFRLVDAGREIGDSWRGRYDSLRLHTARSLSALPGLPIPKHYGQWVRRDDLVAYLREYARDFELFPEFGVRAQRIDRGDLGWLVRTTAGDIEARAVVVATGYSNTPYLPEWPGRDSFPGPIVHTSAYREPSPYRGQRVLVVGSGNSAADVVVDLDGVAGEVIMAVRTPPNIIRRDTFGVPTQLIGIATDKLPATVKDPMTRLLRGATVPDLSEHGLPAPGKHGYRQFERTRTVPILDYGFVDVVRAGRVRIVPAVTGFADGRVRLADDSTAEVDAVIAGTGYRTGLEPLVGHHDVLDERGMPLVSGAGTLPSSPGLHFLGIKVELSGVLRDIRIEAGQIARALAGTA